MTDEEEELVREIARLVESASSATVSMSAFIEIKSIILSALTSARQSEREECAKIAETLKTLKAWLPTGDNGEGESEHATIHGEAIASSIRSRSGTEKAT